ncbi:hypothetical protein IKF26_02330 [Candidatus Saccharibacteria bacterium]|nr:hypothetical protein [Candidatus Saccharibacteria bacterium]
MSFAKLLEKFTFAPKGWPSGQKPYSNRLTYEDLINAESELGKTLFGPIPMGHQREFFKHKNNVWIWHEGWTDQAGTPQEITIRYEVRPTGVFKKNAGGDYQKIEGEELDNFRRAAKSYLELVKSKLYC